MGKLENAIAEMERHPLVKAAKAKLEADRKNNPKLTKQAFAEFVRPGWGSLGSTWADDYWGQYHVSIAALTPNQRTAYKQYEKLIGAKTKKDNSGSALGLSLIKGVIGGIAGLGITQALSLGSVASSAGNVVKGIDFAAAAAPGVNLANPLIGTGIKLAGSTVLDGAVSSSVLSGLSLADITSKASNLFKGAQVAQKLAGAGATGGGATEQSGGGTVDFNLANWGLDMQPTGTQTPIGAQTNTGTTPPVIMPGGGGGTPLLPLLALGAFGLFLWKAKK